MSRLEDAKRRLRAAADAAEPERHIQALTDRTPITAFALGLAVGVAIAALPPVRRRIVRAVLAPPEAAPRSLPRTSTDAPSPRKTRR